MKQMMREIGELKLSNQELERTIDDKDIRISVIQAKVMEKKNENSASEAQLEKVCFNIASKYLHS